MFDTKVNTSYTSGMTINMDANAMVGFLENLAMTTIVQCREMQISKGTYSIDITMGLPYYDDLIDKYISGVHGSIINRMVAQNVIIMYTFIQDCVLNDTVKGLYLLQDESKSGEPVWKLIILALEEYEKYVKRLYNVRNERIPSDRTNYTEYNNEFAELMNKELDDELLNK